MVSLKRKEGFVRTEPVRKEIGFKLLQDVEREDVKWLWYPYIPAGKITLIEGDPGQGKSWITCSLAADISAGRSLPGQKHPLPPQNVLMLSSEDGLGDTVRPRIEDMGGDLTRVFVSDDYFTLDKDGVASMEDLMRKVSATIVFMDPIVAYMGGKIDMHRANEVRELMAALDKSARNTGSAIVAVRHLRKAQGGKAIYSGIGSIDFTAAARSVLQVMETEGGTKYLYHAKHNLTPKGESLAYKIDNTFHWEGVLSNEEVEKKVSKKPKAQADAEAFLIEFLKDGPRPALDVREAAGVKGISQQSIQRAKTGIAYSKKIGSGEWMWFLEGQEGKVSVVETKVEQISTLPDDILEEARARLALLHKV